MPTLPLVFTYNPLVPVPRSQAVPLTSNLLAGAVVPIPTLVPSAQILPEEA